MNNGQYKTCLEKYGCKHPAQNKDVLEKMKQTNIEIYGVDKNEDELLAVFDAAEPEEEIAKSNTSNLIHEEVEDKIAAASSEE